MKFPSIIQTHFTDADPRCATLDFQIQILGLKAFCQKQPKVGGQSMISVLRAL